MPEYLPQPPPPRSHSSSPSHTYTAILPFLDVKPSRVEPPAGGADAKKLLETLQAEVSGNARRGALLLQQQVSRARFGQYRHFSLPDFSTLQDKGAWPSREALVFRCFHWLVGKLLLKTGVKVVSARECSFTRNYWPGLSRET